MDQFSSFSWSDMRVLLAIRDHGGASHAARALDLSHQTVSRRLSALEAALGLRLVNRERHPWVLTQRGYTVCDHAARMDAITREVTAYAHRTRPDKIERVSIACNAWGFDLLVLPVLDRVRQRHPELAFDFITGDDLVDVQGGRADIALRFSEAPPPELLGRKIGDLSMGVFGRAEHIADLDQGLTSKVTVIRSQNRQHDRIWAIAADEFRSVVTVDDFSTLVSAVQHGIGVAALPKVVGARCTDLVCSTEVTVRATRSVWLLRNADSRGSKLIWSIENEILRHGQKLLGCA